MLSLNTPFIILKSLNSDRILRCSCHIGVTITSFKCSLVFMSTSKSELMGNARETHLLLKDSIYIQYINAKKPNKRGPPHASQSLSFKIIKSNFKNVVLYCLYSLTSQQTLFKHTAVFNFS